MSANITVREDGSAEMFSGNNQVPWHGMGQVVAGTVTAAEAIKLAKMDWKVTKEPVFVGGSEFTDYKAIVRADNQTKLAIVKNRYHPIQNEDAFNFFDEVVGSGQAVYETAGTLDEGRKIWIMAKLPTTIFLTQQDKIDKWVMLCSSHDGSRSVWMQLVTVRVVCQNTLSAALATATNQIKLRHTKNFAQRQEEAQRVLDIANGYFGKLEEVMKRLATVPCKEEDVLRFNETLFPAKENEKGIIEVSTRTQNIRDSVTSLFKRGAGNVGETRYDYLNAITDFADHTRGTRSAEGEDKAEARFESAMIGSGASLKQRAMDLLLVN